MYHKSSGKTVRAVHRRGTIERWVADARMEPFPAITYNPSFFNFDETMQKLVRLHECGHLAVPTSNEYLANCYALGRMKKNGTLTPAALARIRSSMSSSQGVIPSNYGGSGAEFWRGTVNYCPGLARGE